MKKSLGLFGIGRWGKNIARNFFELGVLNSVYDPRKDNIIKYKDALQNVVFCENEDEIFSNPNIDKVAIVTRIPDHVRLIVKALNAKKHVFVEKPICFDLNDAQYIKSLAKKNNRIVMAGHLLHYHPVVVKMKEMIEDKTIGDLVSISCSRLDYGYIKEERNSLWSLATHDISLILSIMKSKPQEVLALTQRIYDHQTEDIYNCFFNFENDIKAHIKVNWLNPYKEQKFIVIGTKGLLLFDDTAKWEEKLKFFKNDITKFSVKSDYNVDFIKVDYKEPLKNECKYFLNCCENNIEPFTNMDESIRVIEVIKALLNNVNEDQYLSLTSNYFISPSFENEEDKIISAIQN